MLLMAAIVRLVVETALFNSLTLVGVTLESGLDWFVAIALSANRILHILSTA